MSTPGMPPARSAPNPNIQCRGKDRFDTHDVASKVARAMCQRKDGGLQAYRCPHCVGYHIGGTGLRGQKRQARARRLRLGELREQS